MTTLKRIPAIPVELDQICNGPWYWSSDTFNWSCPHHIEIASPKVYEWLGMETVPIEILAEHDWFYRVSVSIRPSEISVNASIDVHVEEPPGFRERLEKKRQHTAQKFVDNVKETPSLLTAICQFWKYDLKSFLWSCPHGMQMTDLAVFTSCQGTEGIPLLTLQRMHDGIYREWAANPPREAESNPTFTDYPPGFLKRRQERRDVLSKDG